VMAMANKKQSNNQPEVAVVAVASRGVFSKSPMIKRKVTINQQRWWWWQQQAVMAMSMAQHKTK